MWCNICLVGESGYGRFFNIIIIAAFLWATVTFEGAAQVTGPVYPPQGGVTFSGSGANGQVAGESTGRTLFYSNFNEANLSALYWTFYSIENPRLASQSSTGQMTFSGYNATTGIVTWNSSANMTWNTAFGSQSVQTQLLLQFQPYTGSVSGPLGSGWLVPTTASTAGIGSLPGAQSVLNVFALPGTDNYQVWMRYQTSGGTPLLDYYDSTNSTSGSTMLSASGGFYQTVIPEPGAAALLLVASAFFATARRRRTSLA